MGTHFSTSVVNLWSGTSTRASVGSMVQNCAATQGVAVAAQPHARAPVAVRGGRRCEAGWRHTGKFSAATLMLHMRLKVVDLPTLGMPTRPVCQAASVAALLVRPQVVARLYRLVAAAQGTAAQGHGGPTLAEGLPLSRGQPRETAALPAFTLFVGRPSSTRFSGSCQSREGLC